MENIQKNFFREIDLFDFTSFFAWTFLNFLARCETKANENSKNIEICQK